jgi:hypothetical protein
MLNTPHTRTFLPAAVDEAAVSACRQWLQQLQSFIMALQRDVDAFSMEAVRNRRITPMGCMHVSGTEETALQRREEGEGGEGMSQTEDVMCLPSVTSWREFLTSISSQFDAAVEEMDKVEKLVRDKGARRRQVCLTDSFCLFRWPS